MPRFPALTLRGVRIDPPLFCAPMSNITHCAFRRLLADFGGYGALFTEMLSAKMILHEDPQRSPWLKRRPQEGKVFYQLLVSDTGRLPEILDRLAVLHPDGIDLNCACAAANVRRQGGGAALFEDPARLGAILHVMRRHFEGPLTVKIRLGRQAEGWRERLGERLRLLEEEGVDAVFLHPRFTEDKFKRYPRHALYAELAAETHLPIVANGDISGADYVLARAAQWAPVAGLMIGRMAAACPWFFAQWHNPELRVDRAEVWERLCQYITEDFPAIRAMRRIKIVTPYFARNFLFSHSLFTAVQPAPDLAAVRARAAAFLAGAPVLAGRIALEGL